jgi:hypothetical protein
MLSGFYLTLMMGSQIATPVPQEITDSLMNASVTTTLGQASGFQLTFAVSKKSIITNVLLPAGFFDPGIRVILVVIANGFPNVLMDGIITRQEMTPSNDPAKSTLTVTGEDLTVLMSFDHSVKAYYAMATFEIVNLILADYALYGIVPSVVPPLEVDVESPTDGWTTQDATDLDFVNGCAEEAGYVFYLTPGQVPGTSVAYFGPEVRIGIPQTALNINMDSFTNVESLSFVYDGLAQVQPTVTILDPITEEIPITIPIPNVSLLRPPLSARPATALRTEPLEDVANLDPVRAASLGLASAAKPDPITGSGQLDIVRYGQILKARQLVGVRGAGLAYDGLYYVTSVTHNIKRGEYKQSFSLAREGLISLTPVVFP